jgi:hypothetical protein
MLNLGSTWGWVISPTLWPFYPRGSGSFTYCRSGWACPRAGLDGDGNLAPTGLRTQDISRIYSYRLWNILTVLPAAILSLVHISLMFCHYISCIYIYRLWNILTVLPAVILSLVHISFMFWRYISCIYSYGLWIVLTVILSHIHISWCSVTTYPVYTVTGCEIYWLSY